MSIADLAARFMDSLSARIEKLEADLARWKEAEAERTKQVEEEKRKLLVYQLGSSGNYWAWQGDGSDHLESLTCNVQIRPEQLAAIIAERDRLTKELEREERDHLETIDHRDKHEERINSIVRECGLGEYESSWTSHNDPSHRAIEYIAAIEAQFTALRTACEAAREQIAAGLRGHEPDITKASYGLMKLTAALAACTK